MTARMMTTTTTTREGAHAPPFPHALPPPLIEACAHSSPPRYNMNGYGGYGGYGGGYMGGPGMMRSGGGWNYNNRGQPSMFGGQDDWYPTDRYASPCEADMYD